MHVLVIELIVSVISRRVTLWMAWVLFRRCLIKRATLIMRNVVALIEFVSILSVLDKLFHLFSYFIINENLNLH